MRARERQPNGKEKLRASQGMAKRWVRSRGQWCRGRCQLANGQFREGAVGGRPVALDFFDH